MNNSTPKKLKHAPPYLLMLLFASLFIFGGCADADLKPEDIIFAEIYYIEDSAQSESIETLVSSTREADHLAKYYEALINTELTSMEISEDLHYRLDLRTSDLLLQYDLYFDLTEKKGIASRGGVSYEIPFRWVNEYLTDLPINEKFQSFEAPIFKVSYGDDDVSTTITKDWTIHPTEDVNYKSSLNIASKDTISINGEPLVLSGLFNTNGPDSITVEATNIDTYEIQALECNFKQNDTSIASIPLPEVPGNYIYNIHCLWDSTSNGYSGTINYSFDVHYSRPLAFHIDRDTYKPGDTIAVVIENAPSLDYKVVTKTFTKTVGLFYLGNSSEDNDNDLSTPAASETTPRTLVGIIPLSSWTTPGNYTVDIYDERTDEMIATLPYVVGKLEIPRQDLTVSRSTASLKSNDNSAKDKEKFKPARAYSVGEKLWEGAFLIPVDGRITTEYASDRYVNGESVASSRHNAIDIAAELGTPIQATNNGIVTFASDLIISGNVVVIDHGYGIFSSYVHMHKIYVEVGQEVKKGEVIGEVGSTGYSTGPHLHWSIWKNGVYLNPWTFVDQDPLADFK